MLTDAFPLLLRMSVIVAFSTALMLVVRLPLRKLFGARIAYVGWALIPLAMIVALLPGPSREVAILQTTATLVAAATPMVTDPATVASVNFSRWLVLIWLVGAASWACLLFIQQYRFRKGLGDLVANQDGTWRAQHGAGCPALLGAWRPRVILPPHFDSHYDALECRLVLAHERAHRARGDTRMNALAALLRCINWFNPLVHYAIGRFRFDQELACDALVLARHPGSRRSYADAMLKTQLVDSGLPVGCHWQSSHPLKERITMLKHPAPRRGRVLIGRVLMAGMLLGTSYVVWASQPASIQKKEVGNQESQIANQEYEIENRKSEIADRASEIEARKSEMAARSSQAHINGQPAAEPTSTLTNTPASYRELHVVRYPPAEIRARHEGVVYLKIRVQADGHVGAVEVARLDPPDITALGEAARKGVESWTFEPAQHDGKPLASDALVPIVFTLARKHAPPVSAPDGALDAIVIEGTRIRAR